MKLWFICLVIASSVFSFNAMANKDKEKAYLNSNDFQKQLYGLGVHWDRKLLNLQMQCKSKYFVKPISVSYIKPLKFDADHLYPIEGIWTTRFKFTRCDETIIYNALVTSQDGKKPQMRILVPGVTSASPTLIRDLYSVGIPAAVALKSKGKNCKDIQVLDTQVTMKPKQIKEEGKTFKGVWEEKWKIKACNKEIENRFCFIPDGKGGTTWVSKKCPV